MFDGCHNLIMILVIFDLVQYVVALILDKDECVYYVFPFIFQNEFWILFLVNISWVLR